jgi:glyoxylase-like metal-dependent hydrolase (beta-lactamase superfamily II)
MEDGGIFEVADATLEVIHAPGHTDGSVCLYSPDLGVVFTGDTLRPRVRCRTRGEFPDFAGQLTAIGEYLLALPPDTRVLPGHGEETTIADGREEVRLLGLGRPRPVMLAGT